MVACWFCYHALFPPCSSQVPIHHPRWSTGTTRDQSREGECYQNTSFSWVRIWFQNKQTDKKEKRKRNGSTCAIFSSSYSHPLVDWDWSVAIWVGGGVDLGWGSWVASDNITGGDFSLPCSKDFKELKKINRRLFPLITNKLGDGWIGEALGHQLRAHQQPVGKDMVKRGVSSGPLFICSIGFGGRRRWTKGFRVLDFNPKSKSN